MYDIFIFLFTRLNFLYIFVYKPGTAYNTEYQYKSVGDNLEYQDFLIIFGYYHFATVC